MLTAAEIRRTVALALEEDAPWGDITSTALFGPDVPAEAELVAREPGRP